MHAWAVVRDADGDAPEGFRSLTAGSRWAAEQERQRRRTVDPVRRRLSLDVPCRYAERPWQFLYFFPLPQGQGSLRPTVAAAGFGAAPSSSRLVRSCRCEGGTAA